MFKLVHEAYSTLIEPTERKRYDSKLNSNRQPPPSPRPRATPSAAPASSRSRKKKTAPPPTPARRTDLDIESGLEITLEDAVQGATYVLSIQQNDAVAKRQAVHSCRVDVPAGVYEGQRLRLRGLGYVDRYQGGAGDLYLTIRYARHTSFRIILGVVHSDLVLTPWEAALGGRVSVATLDGMADLNVPAGTQPGQRLRLPAQGIPLPDGERGEHQVTVKLRVPAVVSEKERQLWQALASQHRS